MNQRQPSASSLPFYEHADAERRREGGIAPPAPAPDCSGWAPLDVDRPVAHLREVAGHANPKRAAEALGMPASTFRSLEQSGGGAKVARLRALAAELGVELRIEVRAAKMVEVAS